MILSFQEIEAAIRNGRITIYPSRRQNVQELSRPGGL